jgi:hypothetical protein
VYELNARASRSIGIAWHIGAPLLSAALELAMTGRPRDLPAASMVPAAAAAR